MARGLAKISIKHGPNLFTTLEFTLGEKFKRFTACMNCFQSLKIKELAARLAHPIYTSIAAQNAPSSPGRAPCQSEKRFLIGM